MAHNPHDLCALPSPAAAAGYWTDARQRSGLFFDGMRRDTRIAAPELFLKS